MITAQCHYNKLKHIFSCFSTLTSPSVGGGWHGSKGGDIKMDAPTQHVIQRSSVVSTKWGSCYPVTTLAFLLLLIAFEARTKWALGPIGLTFLKPFKAPLRPL